MINNGTMIRDTNESSTSIWATFRSSDNWSTTERPKLVIITSTPYYGNRSYESSTGTSPNCMGYALNVTDYIDYLDLGITTSGLDPCTTTSELLSYIKSKSETWMTNNLGSTEYNLITSYTSAINSDQYRVVLRVGYFDADGDGIVELNIPTYWEDDWDYHWWYQTSTGQWAEKMASSPSSLVSGTSGTTNPYNEIWQNGSLYYNSSCVYYAINN